MDGRKPEAREFFLRIYTVASHTVVQSSSSGNPTIRQSGIADFSLADFKSTMADSDVS